MLRREVLDVYVKYELIDTNRDAAGAAVSQQAGDEPAIAPREAASISTVARTGGPTLLE